jgi:hypothetical protein
MTAVTTIATTTRVNKIKYREKIDGVDNNIIK